VAVESGPELPGADAEALASRLAKRITALRMKVEAQITAQLARLKRDDAPGDASSRNETH
jgi:hypothetical protein